MAFKEKLPIDSTILLVDDFATMRRILKNVLIQLGYSNFIEAEDGTVALERLEEGGIDFVISDWNMPKMMGIDLLRAVRSNDELQELPFLMVAAESQKFDLGEAVEAGMSNYIVKPFNADVMKQKLEAMFRE